MPQLVLIAADLVAIGVLVLGVYFPRHRRRDLVAAYLGVNVGVLAVSTALSSSTVGVGLGLGLFGVLSIIRLRSTELAQTEVAFYFAALALGLLGGLGAGTTGAEVLVVALMALVVAVMWAGGHPRLLRRYRQQQVVLDRAFTDETAMVAHLEGLFDARVHQATVQRVDLVDDTTTVDVRFELGSPSRHRVPSATQAAEPSSTVPREPWMTGPPLRSDGAR